MKLKIYLVAFFALIHFAVNATENEKNDNENLGKRFHFEIEDNENIAKRQCVDENLNNNNNINEDNENGFDDEELDEEDDSDRFFHDSYENSYTLLSDLEKWKQEILLVAKIENINILLKNGIIDELTKRKNIIKAVSETFNVRLLGHFHYVTGEDFRFFNNDATYDEEDFEYDEEHFNYLRDELGFEEKDIRFIENFDYFSINNLDQLFLLPENFNKFLSYFPWIKKIYCRFDNTEITNYEKRVFKGIKELFSNMEYLKDLEEIEFISTNNTNIDINNLPKWTKKLTVRIVPERWY